MTVEPITLLHGAMVALLATSSLGSLAASYVFWVVKCAAPESLPSSIRQCDCG